MSMRFLPGERWRRDTTVRLLMVLHPEHVTYLVEAAADPLRVNEVRNATRDEWAEWARDARREDDSLSWLDDPPAPLCWLNDWLLASG